jgi:hypothetical protein
MPGGRTDEGTGLFRNRPVRDRDSEAERSPELRQSICTLNRYRNTSTVIIIPLSSCFTTWQ